MNDLVARARRLLEANQYLTLATADATGMPWSSTVWYTAWQRSRAPEALAVDFVWLSRPEAQHSRNLVERPEVGISIFDSTQPAGTGIGLQFAARAESVPTEELDEALEAFSRASVAAGGGSWTRAKVDGLAVLRPYVARIETAFLLGDGTRVEVPLA
jgi:uncharacterized protein YhbP (UPF0306 family)